MPPLAHAASTASASYRLLRDHSLINGERPAQMKHVRDIKAAGGVSLNAADGADTSKDQDWDLDESPSALRADSYVFYTTVLWLGIKITIMAIPMLLAHFPPLLVTRLYISAFPDGTERVIRGKVFYVCCTLTLILAIPAVILIVTSYLLDFAAYYLFCIPYCIVTNGWDRRARGMEAIAPYRNGPSVVLHLPDFFVCCMGQCMRQSSCETLYMVSCMWLLMPWLKYYINCNPYIYELDHRLCQQISTEMQDIGHPETNADDVARCAQKIISMTRQERSMQQRINIWSFVPHYPYPPIYRRWALGLQAGGSDYPGKFTLIVHTTHYDSPYDKYQEETLGKDAPPKNHYVLSNSCKRAIYRVMLWYSNPFHFLTGWVEASVSTGEPSQSNKNAGGEHPMWLVTGRTPQVAGRNSWTGSGMIDAFFDYWLPVFVHEMRLLDFLHKGKTYSEAVTHAHGKYQEVKFTNSSISFPCETVGYERYGETAALREMERIAEEHKKSDLYNRLENAGAWVAASAETEIGKTFAKHAANTDEEKELTKVWTSS